MSLTRLITTILAANGTAPFRPGHLRRRDWGFVGLEIGVGDRGWRLAGGLRQGLAMRGMGWAVRVEEDDVRPGVDVRQPQPRAAPSGRKREREDEGTRGRGSERQRSERKRSERKRCERKRSERKRSERKRERSSDGGGERKCGAGRERGEKEGVGP
eukprot:3721451-Rhodomonas_salina.1